MGGMGLASRLDLSITQVGISGSRSENSEFLVVAEGDIVRTSNVMRQAAVANGGLDLCCAWTSDGGIYQGERGARRNHVPA